MRRIVLAIAALLTPLAAQAADLRVEITGVQGDANTVRVVLYNSAETFRHEAQAVKVLDLPATPGTVVGSFDGIPAGRYAILAYHDENGNGKFDMMLGMFPAEGWGLSNDPTIIGPPSFDDSAFDVIEPGGGVSVALHY